MGRKSRNLPERKFIYINGENKNQTERNYLKYFAKDLSKKGYELKFVSKAFSNPSGIVDATIRDIRKSKRETKSDNVDDLYYCVFDTDADFLKNEDILKAYNLANKNKIKIILSSPCIELWFILHFEYTTKFMTSDEAIDRLNCDLSKACNERQNIYCKGVIPDILYDEKRIQTAIKRAECLREHFEKDKVSLLTAQANPYSDMYIILNDFFEIINK